MPSSVLHINPDDFHASLLRIKDPTLKRRPLLIALPHSRSRIISCSYEARAEGVTQGMRIEEAQRLSPRAIWIPFQEGERLFKKITWKLLRFLTRKAPRIEPGDFGESYLDVEGCEDLFGPPQDQAAGLRREIQDHFHLGVSVGVATNKLVSRGASSDAKKNGLVDVFPGFEAQFLEPWPVIRLPGVSSILAVKFEERSVATVGDLAGIPMDWMESWLGVPGRTLAQRARGKDSSIVRDLRQHHKIRLSRSFEPEILDRDLVEAHGVELATDVARVLRRKILRSKRITISLEYAGGRIARGSYNSRQGMDSDQEIITGIQKLLKRLDTYRQRIRGLVLEADRLDTSELQGQLWALDHGPNPDHQTNKTLSKVRDMVRTRFKDPKALYWGSAARLYSRLRQK